MPTYSYRCKNCGAEFDQYQKFTDSPLTRCPTCRKNMLRRVFQASAIVFKGKGWYATDSRSPSGARAMAEKADQAEKPEKVVDGDKPDKAEKSEKNEKADKIETTAKVAKPEATKAAKKDAAPASDA
jgi:putative FmdB family regulatory protein